MTPAGPMPWRLQIATQWIAAALGNDPQHNFNPNAALNAADALIAVHFVTAPKCEHPRERCAQGTLVLDKTSQWHNWCLDCGAKL